MSGNPSEEVIAVRHHLIEEAAKFLINPKVASHAEEKKSAFLKKKGLNDEEILAAFSKARGSSPVEKVGHVTSSPESYASDVVTGYLHSSPQQSLWVKIRDVCNIIVILGGASYGLNYLYKEYVGPWLTGRQQKTVEESMMELQQSVVSVLKEVQNTLASLDQTLSAQALHIQSLNNREGNELSTRQLDQLRNEVSSMKGLLINKRTFPSTPTLAPSIPTWQRNKTTEKPLEQNEESTVALSNQVEFHEENYSLQTDQDNKDASNGEAEVAEERIQDVEVKNGEINEDIFQLKECEA